MHIHYKYINNIQLLRNTYNTYTYLQFTCTAVYTDGFRLRVDKGICHVYIRVTHISWDKKDDSVEFI